MILPFKSSPFLKFVFIYFAGDIMSLEELGKKAYQKHILEDYKGALKIYETAIKKYPNDSRLLNNRCCCYIRINDFKR